jgi:hypothetical protein
VRHILGQAVALLDLALELIALAVDLRKIVVGKLTPLLFDLACGLFPVSFDSVSIHCLLLSFVDNRTERRTVPHPILVRNRACKIGTSMLRPSWGMSARVCQRKHCCELVLGTTGDAK